MMTVSLLRPEDEVEYTTFVQTRPEALLYASLRYRSFLADLLECDSQYMIARDEGGNVAGILPMMVREGSFGKVANSLPYFGSHGGVLGGGSAAIALTDKFNEFADQAAVSVWIDHPFDRPNALPVGVNYEDMRISQITPLEGLDEVEALLRIVDGSARRNIQKAQRDGVTVRVANDRFDFLEEVHRDNMSAIGGLAKQHAFFEKIPRHFQEDADYRLWLAEHNGKPVAALLLFYFNETVEYFVPATIEKSRNLQPMAAILAAAMVDAARRGYRNWNWGGTWPTQDGVRRFKSKWGAIDKEYRYHIRLNNTEMLSSDPAALRSAYPGFYTIPFSVFGDR